MDAVYINTDPESFGPGTWNSITMMALFSRTPERIQSFIEMAVMQLVSLLCSDCSLHAFAFIRERHPNTYRHRKDSRGENMGMWYWVFDLHNDVNKRLREKYPEQTNRHRVLTLEEAEAIYAPVIALTTEEIEAGMRNACSPQTMDDMPVITFDNIDADDEVHVGEDAAEKQTTAEPRKEVSVVTPSQAAVEAPKPTPTKPAVANKVENVAQKPAQIFTKQQNVQQRIVARAAAPLRTEVAAQPVATTPATTAKPASLNATETTAGQVDTTKVINRKRLNTNVHQLKTNVRPIVKNSGRCTACGH